METYVEIKVIYDDKEIRKALSFYILRVCDMRAYATITYSVILLAIVLSLIYSEYALLSIVFFACAVVLFYVYYLRPIEGYLKFYRPRKGGVYRFSEDKLFIIGEEVQSECLWSIFKKAYEIPSAFLLLDANKFVYVLPKACIGDILILEQMRNLLNTNNLKLKIYQ